MNDIFCIEYDGTSKKRNEPFYFVKSLDEVPPNKIPPPRKKPFVYV